MRIQGDDDSLRSLRRLNWSVPAIRIGPSSERLRRQVANYLQQGVGLVVVDVVTNRFANLHGELLELLGISLTPNADAPPNLYAAAYRTTGPAGASRLQSWREDIALDLLAEDASVDHRNCAFRSIWTRPIPSRGNGCLCAIQRILKLWTSTADNTEGIGPNAFFGRAIHAAWATSVVLATSFPVALALASLPAAWLPARAWPRR